MGTITGFPYLPPFFSLGYHYSKWESLTSASRILEYNENFEVNGIPLDVLWMDIPYTDNNQYFIFSRAKFPTTLLDKLKLTMDMSRRKLVVITDPHIKKNYNYKVYSDGNFV